jgi:hypothetical protein
MKKLVPLALLLALSLSGCGLFHRDHHHGGGYPRNGSTVSDAVSVSGDTIKLAQEVILIRAVPDAPPVTVTWTIDPSTGFRFTQRGIVIEGRLLDKVLRGEQPSVVLDPGQQEIGGCKLADDKGASFSCVVKPTRQGVYKYTIQLTDGKRVISRDPPIVLW